MPSRLGAVAFTGAGMVAVAVFTWTLVFHRLLPADRLVARLGSLLLALSPFFLMLGGSYMNHVTVAATLGVAAWAGLRALEGRAAWALLSGAAVAWSFATRPLSALALGAALAFTLPSVAGVRLTERRTATRAALVLLGAAPLLGLLFVYNDALFGAWHRTGYQVALGPRMSPGFHLDPWGNAYGMREAIAYTSADLTALGVHLFESPLPAITVIGVFLLLAPRLVPGVRVLCAVHMGPRMLHESTPAWVMLFVVAAVAVVRAIPPTLAPMKLNVRSGVGAALLAAQLMGMLLLTPERAASYGGDWLSVTRVPPPRTTAPALVFVHDAWSARVGMTLAARGMRLDLVETLLRQNPTCRIQQLARASDQELAPMLARLDTVPRADRLPQRIEIAPGDAFRAAPGEPLIPACEREILSDTAGILDLAPLLWQGDLLEGALRGALFVRDLGPERNRVMIDRHPRRTPWLYATRTSEGDPVLLPYDEGMRRLWGAQ